MHAPSERSGSSGVAWIEAGDGEAIVFLHGLGGSATAWGPQLEALADRFRCIAWDMPGYGRTPLSLLGTERPGFADLATIITMLLDDAGVERANIVGLSFGGQQALHLALDHPERVDRLIIADSSAVFGGDGTDPEAWKRLRLDPLDRGLQPSDMAETVIDAITGPGFGGPARQAVIDAFCRVTADGLRASVHRLPTHDVVDRLPMIAMPTLIVVGELDEETPPAYSEAMAAAIPDAVLEVIPGVGHLTPSEAPDAFNKLLTDFLFADRSR